MPLREERTGEDGVDVLRGPRQDCTTQRMEPGEPIVVGQRSAVGHLGNVRGRMHGVAVEKRPAELFRQPSADRRFAGAGHAHNNDHHGMRFYRMHT